MYTHNFLAIQRKKYRGGKVFLGSPSMVPVLYIYFQKTLKVLQSFHNVILKTIHLLLSI